MDINRTRQEAAQGPAEWFTGEARLEPIGDTGHVQVRSVRFTAGARTAWHRHPHGQVLHVTDGTGRVQARGAAREDIKAGDTIVTHPGEWHWHGAAPDAGMTHLAISDGKTEWGEHVTDQEYQG